MTAPTAVEPGQVWEDILDPGGRITIVGRVVNLVDTWSYTDDVHRGDKATGFGTITLEQLRSYVLVADR